MLSTLTDRIVVRSGSAAKNNGAVFYDAAQRAVLLTQSQACSLLAPDGHSLPSVWTTSGAVETWGVIWQAPLVAGWPSVLYGLARSRGVLRHLFFAMLAHIKLDTAAGCCFEHRMYLP